MMNKTSYNKIAPEWSAIRNEAKINKPILDFANLIIEGGSILDIGCGTGLPIAGYLSNRGFQLKGIDEAENMVKLAIANNISNATFIHCEFFDFYADIHFDGILAWDSFFHFPKDKQAAIYDKVSLLLKPGGYILFTHGKEEDEHEDRMMGESFYYSSLDKEKVCQLLNENNFEILYLYENYREGNDHRALVILARKKFLCIIQK